METLPIAEKHKTKVTEFFKKQWGSTEMVISSGVYDCSALNGFIVVDHNDDISGLITYIMTNNECEIISLDSLEENKGTGTSLIQAVEAVARENQCTYIKLVTTNDKLAALKFYQKRGYVLSTIHRNAVEEARHLKPEIPLIGNDGIPIRDEIELEKVLN
ncbi:GNAT family N-acetyltransferase [Halobacillus locisalis]|uniref:GNAT family N-acetyltransferase n=1 Tax=Halobacillus locisalis TaxID=220753 RepID=A0A838CT01_9BACI|nr:GNAT family N-acetyltransferase [Halobacillus locisalis]MBA2174895.1 GNAT family N-acetyltransferase [Halobacillus locisalis]